MSPVMIVLIVLGGLLLLGGIAAVGVGMFVVHKVKQAGLDPALMEKNPGLAMTKLLTAVNPNLEVVTVDEGSGKITVRDKKSGETVTMDFEDIKQGRFSFSDSRGKKLEIGTSKLPGWVPAYPGAKGEGTFGVKGDEGEGGTYSFTTKDPAAKVIEFYRNAVQSAGMKVVSSTEAEGTSGGGTIVAENESDQRKLMVTVSSGADGTTVSLHYSTK